MNFICLLFTFTMVSGEVTFNDTKRLRKQLLEGHDQHVRPIRNQTNSIRIGTSLTLFTIVDFDMTSGRLETSGFVTTVWKDEILLWNDTEFKDIESLTFDLDDDHVWNPKIAPINAISNEKELSVIVIRNDGSVLGSTARPFITFCELDMTFFPTDKHICRFEFVSMNHPASELDFYPLSTDVDLSQLLKHGEWKVIQAYSEQKSRQNQHLGTAGIEFVFVLQRQPGFTVLHKAVPLLILGFADIFIHIVPLNSGERISYAVTILLAFVFWQALVTEDLPQNSSQISMFSVLMTSCMIVSGLSTIFSVVLCRMAELGEDRKIPQTFQKMARQFTWEKKNCIKDLTTDKKRIKEMENQDDVKTIPTKNVNLEDCITFHRKVTWMDAANGIDCFFMFGHMFFSLCLIIGFILIFALDK